MYNKYFGTLHSTGEIREYSCCKDLTAEAMLKALSILNKYANSYGITYWIDVTEDMGDVIK